MKSALLMVAVVVLMVVGCDTSPRGIPDTGPPDAGSDAGPVDSGIITPTCEGTTAVCPEGYRDACDSPNVSGLPRWSCAHPEHGPTCVLTGDTFGPLCGEDGVATCDPGETPVCVPPNHSIGCPGDACI